MMLLISRRESLQCYQYFGESHSDVIDDTGGDNASVATDWDGQIRTGPHTPDTMQCAIAGLHTTDTMQYTANLFNSNQYKAEAN